MHLYMCTCTKFKILCFTPIHLAGMSVCIPSYNIVSGTLFIWKVQDNFHSQISIHSLIHCYTAHSMACEESPETYALRSHLTEVTDVVELNLRVIGNRLVEEGFIVQCQLHDILGTSGQTPAQQANSLIRNVVSKVKRSDKREKWFEKFVLILAKDTAEGELVEKLTKDFGRLNHMW